MRGNFETSTGVEIRCHEGITLLKRKSCLFTTVVQALVEYLMKYK